VLAHAVGLTALVPTSTVIRAGLLSAGIAAFAGETARFIEGGTVRGTGEHASGVPPAGAGLGVEGGAVAALIPFDDVVPTLGLGISTAPPITGGEPAYETRDKTCGHSASPLFPHQNPLPAIRTLLERSYPSAGRSLLVRFSYCHTVAQP